MISKTSNKICECGRFDQNRIDRGTFYEPFCKMQIVGDKYHFPQNESIYNSESVEMVFYSILC